MPHSALPEDENDDPTEREVFMRWLEDDGGNHELLEICVGPAPRATDLGRRIRPGLVDVELHSASIVEHGEPILPALRCRSGAGARCCGPVNWVERCSMESNDESAGQQQGAGRIEEDADPGEGSGFIASPSHMDKTRRDLAVAAMLILGLLSVGGLVGWLVILGTGGSVEEMQAFAVIFSPVVALLGPILGFYFSKSSN